MSEPCWRCDPDAGPDAPDRCRYCDPPEEPTGDPR